MTFSLGGNPRLRRGLVAVAVACIVFACAAYAQVLYGSLTGSVTDATNSVVAGATVEALNVGTGVAKETSTNSRGVYSFSDLQPGTYNITISSPSFSKVMSENVSIDANRVVRVNATLQIAQVNEAIQVSGSAIALQTDRAEVMTNLTTKQVSDLPLTGSTGRNFQSLMTIVPGAVMQGEQNSAAGNPQRAISFNVNGVSRLQNNTRMDGASITYPWLPTNIAYVPPAEAIETVNVVTNSYTAEQGMAGGAEINVIIKAGTNQLHGSAWDFHTNSHFKTRNYFQTTPQNPKNILNQLGGSIGGPIIKNKLFYFGDIERTTTRNSSPISLTSIAPADLRAGDFSATGTTIYDPTSNSDPTKRTPFAGNKIPASQIDLAAVEMIKRMPQPTSPGYVDNFNASGVGAFTRTNADIKVNYAASDKMSMFGRYSISPSNIFDPPLLGEAGGNALNGGQLGNAPGRIQIAGAGLTYTITPSLIFDGNVGFTRQRLGAENIDIGTNFGLDVLKIPGTNGSDRLQGGIPAFQISNWANMGNANTGNPFQFRDNQYTANTNLGWMKGPHAFRFGFEYVDQQLNHFQPQGGTFQTARGTFTFNGNSTALQNGAAANRFNSWADFLLGYANTAGKVEQLRNPNSIYMKTFGLYAQDQWQVTRRFTLTYGLRWERYPFATRDWGGVSRFDPADGNVYVGGVGGVPLDTGVNIGAGHFLPRLGVAYRISEKTVIRAGYGISADPKPYIDFRNAYPVNFAWEVTRPNNAFLATTTLRQGLINRPAPPAVTEGVFKLPAGTSTTTFPKDEMRKYVQSWNFTIQREISNGFTVQAGYVGTRAVGQEQFININTSAPGGGTSGRALFSNGITSDINMIMPFKTTTYDGLQTQAIRRWGSSQFGFVYTFSKAINWADNDANPRIPYPGEWQRNRGVASYDRPHNFQSYWVLDTPFGKGHKWMQDGIGGKLLGGWQFNGILSRTSGAPLYIVQNNGLNLNAAGSAQVPDQVKPEVRIPEGIALGNEWFDRSAYQVVNIPSGQQQRFGNSGRNNIRGPKFFNVDAGLFRTVPITERLSMQFRVEALNVLNHPNFNNPGVDISNSQSFGFITSTLGGSERQFRFAARVSF